MELIKTIMLGTLQFWIQSFKFPVSTMKSLASLFAKFLWRDKMHVGPGKKICKPKVEGGLAIRRIKDNNMAAGLRLVWR